MRILGVDPGIATTGFGVIEKCGNRLQVIDFGTIITKPNQDLAERLLILGSQLDDIIKKFEPQTAAVERLFFNVNVKTALTVGQARGVILYSLAKNQLQVADYTPLQVKCAVSGYGRADKKQVQKMVQKLLNLSELPKQDDAADALAIAVCHAHHAQYSLLVKSPPSL